MPIYPNKQNDKAIAELDALIRAGKDAFRLKYKGK
jgi:hypothetical protein